MPGEVATLRKKILKTRDLFDVFSTVYPNRRAVRTPSRHPREKEKSRTTIEDEDRGDDAAEDDGDPWQEMRDVLMRGYELIGEYQDLDHASILYNSSDLHDYQARIWTWHVEFVTSTNGTTNGGYDVFAYLSSPCGHAYVDATSSGRQRRRRCRYVHQRASHLFWGDASPRESPIGDVDAANVALATLGNMQLERAGSYLRDALAHEHVLDVSTGEDTFGYDIPTSAVGHRRREGGGDAVIDGGVRERVVTVHEIYHNARKQLRSFLDVLALFGDMLLPGYSLAPEISMHDDAPAATTADVIVVPPPPPQRLVEGHATEDELINNAVDALESARKMLGDLNDEYSAYVWYRALNEHPEERSRLMMDIEARWKEFRIWQEEAGLSLKIDLLRQGMAHQ